MSLAGRMIHVPRKTKPKDVELRRIFEKELDRALSWLSKKYRVPKPLLMATSSATVKRLEANSHAVLPPLLESSHFFYQARGQPILFWKAHREP